jgi:RNA-splicing ligase RtcB
MIDEVDEATMSQIYTFLNHPAFAHTYIAIMPDCHAGAGAVIGFTSKLNEYIIPNVVGVDIGCGIEAFKLVGIKEIDFDKLDKFIRKHIPSGFSRHGRPLDRNWENFSRYRSCINKINNISDITEQNFDDVHCQLQTLGGGNHFIEIDKDEEGNFWLVIHTGSRNFGLKVAKFYQDKACKLMDKMLIKDNVKGLEYLPFGYGGGEYLDAMDVAQEFARTNRELIAAKILEDFFDIHIRPEGLHKVSSDGVEIIRSVHNYINLADGIIRKGAISAHVGEKLLIPLNMRDGIIFGTGKGNSKWNFSAPHGAGRIYSRSQAKKELSFDEFKETMEGIWSSCISESTLDESPMAYKDGSAIVGSVDETTTIDFIAKPVYNFKA